MSAGHEEGKKILIGSKISLHTCFGLSVISQDSSSFQLINTH